MDDRPGTSIRSASGLTKFAQLPWDAWRHPRGWSLSLRLLFLALFVMPHSATGASLKAGVAKVDITPPAGTLMWGYFDRLTPAKSTLDPLYARVLVLETGETRLALVALDLGRTFGPASLAHIREAARKSSGISHVLVVAAHTHAGPVILDEYPSGKVPAWETADLSKIGQAIDEAHRHAVEARLGTGRGVAYISYNRRRVNPDGTVTMFWSNPTKVPTSPIDPTVSVLRVDRADGKPLAVLVNYACHPVVFGADNLEYSADFPGVTTQTVETALEQATGSRPLSIFLQGAPGDINPYYATIPRAEDAVKWRDWTGQRLGEEAARVAKSIHTEAVAEPSLQFAEDTLDFRLRWNPEKFRAALLAAYGQTIFENYAPAIQPVMRLPATTLLINKRIAFMTMPGEPFVDFQINWRDRCPVQDALFLGYANGYNGYFPTIRAASEGGYGTASATTWTEVGAGERMVDHALARVYEMLGRLSDLPEDLKVKDAGTAK
jgi:neutral/alkaline ceramidase-like enzyme